MESDNPEIKAFYERVRDLYEKFGAIPGWNPADIAPLARSSDVDERLFGIGALRLYLDNAEMTAVFDARVDGRSWSWIASRLGKTRQALWERYGPGDSNS